MSQATGNSRPIHSSKLQVQRASCSLSPSTCLTEISVSSPKLHSHFPPPNISPQPTQLNDITIHLLLELKSKELSFFFTPTPHPSSHQVLSVQPINTSDYLPPSPLQPPSVQANIILPGLLHSPLNCIHSYPSTRSLHNHKEHKGIRPLTSLRLLTSLHQLPSAF